VQDLTPASDKPVQDRANGRFASIVSLTPLAAAFRYVEPTWRNYIVYVEMEAKSGNGDAARYVAAWKALTTREKQIHAPEQLCDLCSVSQDELIRWVSGNAWKVCQPKASLCMSFMRDKVLERSAEFAMAAPENYKHAEMFLRASGALPVNAGSGGGRAPVNQLFYMPVASSGSVTLPGGRTESSPVDRSGLRDMDSEVVELSKIMATDQGEAKRKEREPDETGDEEDDDENEDEDDEPA